MSFDIELINKQLNRAKDMPSIKTMKVEQYAKFTMMLPKEDIEERIIKLIYTIMELEKELGRNEIL